MYNGSGYVSNKYTYTTLIKVGDTGKVLAVDKKSLDFSEKKCLLIILVVYICAFGMWVDIL